MQWRARPLRALLLFSSMLVAGCASMDPAETPEAPEPRFAGSLSAGEIRGERAGQLMGALEARVLQAFPRATWSNSKASEADIVVDLTTYSAHVTEARSTQEQKTCRRWSEPDKDAKSTLQRLASRNCLDWQVQNIPCVTRRYELDVQFRARDRQGGRLIVSDRKAAVGSDRQCGEGTPAVAPLQARVETEVASWATGLLRQPLVQFDSARAIAAGLQPAAAAMAASTALAAATTPTLQLLAPATAPTTSQASPQVPLAQPSASVASGQAHALVIGNAAYPGSARLANPLNDSQAISRKFAELGFAVTRIDDGNREALVRGLSQFQRKAASSQITVLYYSGHGMQIDGINYLLPVDVDINKPASLKLQAVSLDTVIGDYLPGKVRIVFLDACRDNPAASSTVRGFNRGLAPIQAPTGTLIAFATRDGGVAEDGTGKHSPFTQALLDLIAEPEDISLVLRKVRDKVMRDTSGRQQPWEYGSLSGGSLIFSRLVR